MNRLDWTYDDARKVLQTCYLQRRPKSLDGILRCLGEKDREMGTHWTPLTLTELAAIKEAFGWTTAQLIGLED